MVLSLSFLLGPRRFSLVMVRMTVSPPRYGDRLVSEISFICLFASLFDLFYGQSGSARLAMGELRSPSSSISVAARGSSGAARGAAMAAGGSSALEPRWLFVCRAAAGGARGALSV